MSLSLLAAQFVPCITQPTLQVVPAWRDPSLLGLQIFPDRQCMQGSADT